MRKENVTLRALKQYHNYNRSYFPLKFLQLLLRSLSPYFNLWMSSEIVTALYESRSTKELYLLVSITLLGNLLIPVLESVVRRNVDTALKVLTDEERVAFNRKTLSLDYDKLENPKIRFLRRKIWENEQIDQGGVVAMRLGVERAMQAMINLLLHLLSLRICFQPLSVQVFIRW